MREDLPSQQNQKGVGLGFGELSFLAFLMLIVGLTGIRTQQILGYFSNISLKFRIHLLYIYLL